MRVKPSYTHPGTYSKDDPKMTLFTSRSARIIGKLRRAKWLPSVWAIGLGVLTAALLCSGFVAGFLSSQTTPGITVQLPSGAAGLHATASSESEKFVMSTGFIEQSVEGVFILDTLSGDLQCTAYNSRAGGFNARFGRKILEDLKVGGDKRPEFMMVTGQIQLRNVPGIAGSPLTCVAYVVEGNTGNFAAYAVPWNTRAYASGNPQQGELILLQAGSAQTAAVRE